MKAKLESSLDVRVVGFLVVAVVFLLMPDGVPFAEASCDTIGLGSAANATIDVCASCVEPGTTNVVMGVYSCTVVSASSTKCQFTVSTGITIYEGCTALWFRSCDGTDCPPTAGAYAFVGPGSDTIEFTTGCDGDGDVIGIRLNPDASCTSCIPNTFFRASAVCDLD